MTVSLKHNDALEVNRVEYSGVITAEELMAHAQFRGDTPDWLSFDHLNVVLPDADVSALTRAVLDELHLKHQKLFDTRNLPILRRSAWICQSAAALDLLNYWLTKHAAASGAHTDVRLFETFEAAGEWLVLNEHEKALAARGEGFREIACFTAAPAP